MVAATKGRYQICQLLLEHGAVVGIPPEAKVATKVHSCRSYKGSMVSLGRSCHTPHHGMQTG